MNDADRCPFLDRAGCRCLLHRDHGGVHDPSYTVYAEVLKVRAELRLEALRRAAEAKP